MFATLSQARQQYIAARDAVSKVKAADQAAEADRLFSTDFQPAGARYLDSLQALLDQQRASINTTATTIRSGYERGSAQLLALGLAAIVAAIALAVVITRNITRPLHRAVSVAETVAGGDLTMHVGSNAQDETGQLLRALDAAMVPRASHWHPARSPAATWTCPATPKNKPARCSRQRHRWSK